MARTYSFEEVERHIDSLNLDEFQTGGRLHFSADAVAEAPGNVLEKVCAIYRGVRPILIVLQSFPLIPKKFRQAIELFTSLMDTLCSSQ